jgi:hypothetical protein
MNELEATGNIPLSHVLQVVADSEEKSNASRRLSVVLRGNERRFSLKAKTVADRDMWLHTLNKAMKSRRIERRQSCGRYDKFWKPEAFAQIQIKSGEKKRR